MPGKIGIVKLMRALAILLLGAVTVGAASAQEKAPPGFSVATFASAEEFLASERAAAPACLVLDVHLDGMSGFDLQERLATAGVPIPTIFITAHDDPVTRARARSGVAYLQKPFREDALIGAIQQALEGRGA